MESQVIEVISAFSILLLIAAFTSLISNYIKLPYTILLVIVGFLGSVLGEMGPAFFQPLHEIEIHPDIILFACLPTLLFESAFTMDARLLRYNLVPVLTLAIPGLFLSTGIIGTFVWLLSPLDFMTSLLLGSILSATDPVAVISLFKQLGVPKRLTILVEGESLFNDSTAIVTAKTIIFVMAAGVITKHTFITGSYEFCWEFFGGIVAGFVFAKMTGYALTFLQHDHTAELALTLLLAYLSFIIADELLHVSGVMATITAGIVIAGWGKMKISTIATRHLHTTLELLAYIANSLIFLLVGFSVHVDAILASAPLLGVVIVAMLASRAIVIFGLIPIISKLPNTEAISNRYQAVMWWGGLRGAIALAIVLGLPNIPHQSILIAVVMGAVLFTILVQGLSINKLIQHLGLDKPLLSDQFSKLEAEMAAEKATLDKIPELQKGGHFSHKIAERLKLQASSSIKHIKHQIYNLRKTQLGKEEERRLLYLSCFATEKYLYFKMYTNAHLHEQAYLALVHDVDAKIDLMKYKGALSESRPINLFKRLYTKFINKLSHQHIPFFDNFVNHLKIQNIVHDYEEKWGLMQACIVVLNHIDEIAEMEAIEPAIRDEVKAHFEYWLNANKHYLDNITEQFPEFVYTMQHKLGERLLLHTKRHIIIEQMRHGLLTQGLADDIIHEYIKQLDQLRASGEETLKLDPHELIRKVPFFEKIPLREIDDIIKLLKEHHASAGETIIQEGAIEDNLYIILRGVVRVIKDIKGTPVELATLMAGDFFGEMAMLHGIKRTATCKAVTPCVLYTLNRKDFERVKDRFPAIKQALEAAAKERAENQARPSNKPL